MQGLPLTLFFPEGVNFLLITEGESKSGRISDLNLGKQTDFLSILVGMVSLKSDREEEAISFPDLLWRKKSDKDTKGSIDPFVHFAKCPEEKEKSFSKESLPTSSLLLTLLDSDPKDKDLSQKIDKVSKKRIKILPKEERFEAKVEKVAIDLEERLTRVGHLDLKKGKGFGVVIEEDKLRGYDSGKGREIKVNERSNKSPISPEKGMPERKDNFRLNSEANIPTWLKKRWGKIFEPEKQTNILAKGKQV
ncbi:MAG: hypothetical protein DRN47_07175, partial [Candidatus Wolframiiraptor sp.]